MSKFTRPFKSLFSLTGRIFDRVARPSVVVPAATTLFGAVLVGADMATGNSGFLAAAGTGVAALGFGVSSLFLVNHHHTVAKRVTAGVGFALLGLAVGFAGKGILFPDGQNYSQNQGRPVRTIYSRGSSPQDRQLDTFETREGGLTQRVPVLPTRLQRLIDRAAGRQFSANPS